MHMATLMEELNSGLGVVLGLIALVVYGIAFVWGWAEMSFRGKAAEMAIKEEQAARLADSAELRKKHAEHYVATGNIQTHVATMGQELSSHIADDHRQLQEIKASLAEGRADLKDMRGEILEAIASLRK